MPVRLRVRELGEQHGLTLSRFQLEARLPMSTARRFWYSTSDGSAHGAPLKQINLDVLDVVAQFFGLAPGDFRLLVDGKPVKIDYFTEVAEGRAAGKGAMAATGAPAAPPAPSGAASAPSGTAPAPALPDVQGVEPGGDVGTSYVVFVDDFFYVLPARRNRVLGEIAKGLDKLGQRTR